MRRQLFRKQVTDSFASNWLGDIRIASPVAHRVWALTALFLTTAFVAWLFFGQYTRRERVQGLLVPIDGLARLKARVPGDVGKVFVTEGRIVSEGDPLVEIITDRSSDGQSDIAADVSDALQRERATLVDDIARTAESARVQTDDMSRQSILLRSRIAQGEEAVRIFEKDAEQQKVLMKRVEVALADGYVSAVQVQQLRSTAASAATSVARQKADVASLQQQLRELEGKIAQASYEARAAKSEAQRQIARTDAAADKNTAERRLIVRAPTDGIVGTVLVYTGKTVGTGSPLATVVPQNAPLEAELFVSTSAIGFVQKGSPVAIQYQAFPYQKFGAHLGEVTYVSRSALTPEEIAEVTGIPGATERMYRVRVRLAQQTVRAYGQARKLSAGMAVTADILIEKRRMYEWLFEPLYSMRNQVQGK